MRFLIREVRQIETLLLVSIVVRSLLCLFYETIKFMK